MRPALHVDVTTHPRQAVVTVSGELDTDTSPLLTQAADALVRHGRTLVLDLAAVTFIDAAALNMLLALRHRARSHGAALQLRAVPAQARHVLDLTGTRHLFTYCPGTGPAVEAGPPPAS
ncbi:STAS domain-containing protein [Streptomyces sp. NPDC058157]|uniref:STAS domain-containing protein n=1 Tax=Streptomyces sp. NPDC058157 TaxID=3346360 RepID=UPI0036EE2FD2